MYMSVLYTYTIDLQSQQQLVVFQQNSHNIEIMHISIKGISLGLSLFSQHTAYRSSLCLSAHSLQIVPLPLSTQPIDLPSVSQHTAYRASLCPSAHTLQIFSLSLSTQPIDRPCISQHTACRSSLSLSARSLQIIPLFLIIEASLILRPHHKCENKHSLYMMRYTLNVKKCTTTTVALILIRTKYLWYSSYSTYTHGHMESCSRIHLNAVKHTCN